MKTLEADTIFDYINETVSGMNPQTVSPALFWAALYISEDAIMNVATTSAEAIGIDPAQALTCMEVGAILALRMAQAEHDADDA
jgi:hypothetical protein